MTLFRYLLRKSLFQKTPSIAATILAFAMPNVALADDVYTVIVKKKQEAKVKNRWTLSEWLATKDRMRMMDMWLALNSGSPFEFFIDGAYVRQTSSSDDQSFSSGRFGAAAYISIFGLQAERLTGPSPRWDALFDVRAFGYHAQATNLTLQAGYRSRSESGGSSPGAPLLGADLTIYLAQYFGLNGVYRHEFKSSGNSADERFSSTEFTVGPFIDFKPLRVYGSYTRSFQTRFDRASSMRTDILSGFMLGTRLFF